MSVPAVPPFNSTSPSHAGTTRGSRRLRWQIRTGRGSIARTPSLAECSPEDKEPSMNTDLKRAYGVHSEVGKLRKVLVCAPGLAHKRLTPTNCDELLFDDVLWVQNAQRDHFDFIAKMRERDIDVVELHNLVTEMLEIPEAKAWLL